MDRSAPMDVRTTRFGVIQIAEDRVITFPKGLLGFPQARRYCLLEPGEDACFFWLQSLDEPGLAFVVTDPALFVGDYSVPIRPEQMGELTPDYIALGARFLLSGSDHAFLMAGGGARAKFLRGLQK